MMFYRWFANFVAVKTEEGIVLVDTGAYFNQTETVAMVRRYGPERINTAIYTHGHVDHALGMAAFIAEGQRNKVARARVVGHRAMAARFDRYKRTAGYNGIVNARQFNGPTSWPTEYVYPDTYFDDRFTVAAGSVKFECHHGRGETDDAAWVYIPQRKVLCTGDFIIWAAPTRVIRKRRSATRGNGQKRCGRWRKLAQRSCCLDMECRYSVRCECARC